jgi:hypothetical protein
LASLSGEAFLERLDPYKQAVQENQFLWVTRNVYGSTIRTAFIVAGR